MSAEFQRAPGPGVLHDGFVVAIAKEDEFVEYSTSALLGLMPSHDGFPGDLAVKYPVIADASWLGLFPDQVALLKTHARGVAPPPSQVDGTGDPIRALGIADGIQPLSFAFRSVTSNSFLWQTS